MQCFSPEDAISWVDQNAKQIIGHSRKYLPFAPYDQEDFLQDAYEAALEAVEVSMERQIPFPACFWVLFKGKVSAVTPNPGSKRNAGSCSPPRTICDFSDFATERLDPPDIVDPKESVSTIDVDRVYPLIREHLTSVEALTLEAVVGIHEGPMKIKEAARFLGCSPANIRQTLARAYSRISGLVESGELNIQIVEGEIVQLPSTIAIPTLEPLEGAVDTQDSEAFTEKGIRRSDDPSEEGPAQDHPRFHQAPMGRKKQNSCLPLDPKTLQATCSDSLENLLVWNDLADGHAEIMTSRRHGHHLADMKGFVDNGISVTRRIAPRIQRESRGRLKINSSGIERKSGFEAANSIVNQISSPNCRNGTIYIFPGTCVDPRPILRYQPMPTSGQNRIQTEPACRNGPVSFNSDALPDRDCFETTLFRLAA
jgi:hypothetical protein